MAKAVLAPTVGERERTAVIAEVRDRLSDFKRHVGRIAALPAWSRAHPDAAAVSFVLVVSALLRLAFAFRAPVLIQGDSETYLGPALDLARGSGFDLMLKRTPGYPLFVAACLAIFGGDLRALGFVQHGLGLATVALTYLLGRSLAGMAAGLVAGLASGLAGNLLIYERFVMTETLFTTLLVAATAALVVAAGRPGWQWPFLAGLLIAAATLVRPVAQALLVLAPVVAILSWWNPTICQPTEVGARRVGHQPPAKSGGTGVGGAGSRRALGRALVTVLLVLLGYGLVLGLWMLRGAQSSEGAAVGALGQTLVGRTARHDRYDPATGRGFAFYDPALDANDPDPTRLAARRMLQEAAQRGSSGRAVHTRLRRELGLSDAQADRLMRDLALEAIRRRLDYYVGGTLERFVRIWTLGPERIGPVWNDRNTIIRAWEHVPSKPLLQQPPAPVEQELPIAEALASFQPSRLGPLCPLLFVLGLAASVVSGRYRRTLIPALAALLMIGLSVALVGGVPRYRYPEDPLIFVVGAVGFVWAVKGLALLRLRLTSRDAPVILSGAKNRVSGLGRAPDRRRVPDSSLRSE